MSELMAFEPGPVNGTVESASPNGFMFFVQVNVATDEGAALEASGAIIATARPIPRIGSRTAILMFILRSLLCVSR
jgi:hypothetical protein